MGHVPIYTCMHIRYVPCKRLPFSARNFQSRAVFTNDKIFCYRASPFLVARQILHLFAISETINFPKFFPFKPECQPDAFIHGQHMHIFTISSSRDPPPPPLIPTKSVPEGPILVPETNCHARACSGTPSLFHFAAAHTYQTVGWMPPPPPSPGTKPL